MLAIILVSSVDSQLEAEILEGGPEFRHLHGLPKALLPITGGKRVLDYWWGAIEGLRTINDVMLVTNAKCFKHFERWATARGIPVKNVVNDGSTMRSTSLGAARDLLLGLRRADWFQADSETRKQSDVMVIAGDSLFHREFDLHTVTSESNVKAGSSLVVSYKLSADEDKSTRGIIEVDEKTRQVVRFIEKPGGEGRNYNKTTDSKIACPLFYVLKPEMVRLLPEFVKRANDGTAFPPSTKKLKTPSLGDFMEWAVNKAQKQQQISAEEESDDSPRSMGALLSSPTRPSRKALLSLEDDKKNSPKIFSMALPGVFKLIGNAGLREYLDLVESFERVDAPGWALGRGTLTVSAKARVGLFGNPSDGYGGKTIALTMANFWASATIAPSDRLALLPHPLFDPCDFGSLADLQFISRREGYQGGMRLLQAACKRFHEYCMDRGVALPKRNFTLSYETNIPRQVGLAGSSAIVTAAMRALMSFYDLDSSHVSDPVLPSLVLSVEAELGIVAGLQDRVVQSYEGLVFMDFSDEYFEDQGHGHYERLLPGAAILQRALPLLFLAYCGEPSDSGRIHSDVKNRWTAGDPEVLEIMQQIAQVAQDAKRALFDGDKQACRNLMKKNFQLRRQLFGDDVLGDVNLELVQIAEDHGGVAKLPGSGGAVVGTCDDDDLETIRQAYEKRGFVFTVIEPYFPDTEKDQPRSPPIHNRSPDFFTNDFYAPVPDDDDNNTTPGRRASGVGFHPISSSAMSSSSSDHLLTQPPSPFREERP